jgi:CLIP-associating protein 1/2
MHRGFTKKIIAEKSQRCVTAIITHCTVHPRIFVAHITAGIDDKNVQTRQYSTSHLKTFIDIHAKRSTSAIEHTPAVLDTIETAVKKGLADVNPQVRETMRLAFWSFHAVWPTRAQGIMENLDGTARKQLEKANPQGNGSSTATARPAKKPTASSAMSALLAEKRRARSAELAAGRAMDRAVSSPVPTSPSVEMRLRSTSYTAQPADESPRGYEPASPTPAPAALGIIPRQDQLGSTDSPTKVSPIHSPPPDAVTPSRPSAPRISLPRDESDSSLPTEPSSSTPTRSDPAVRHVAPQTLQVRGQASPVTPARDTPLPAKFSFVTPNRNGSSRAVWEDSPRPEAMTPLLFAQLKERKHERTWWLKRQELMDKASPLKSASASPDPVEAILPDIQALENGSPSLRTLQKLVLFAEQPGEAWKESRVFDRIFDGLMSFLDPTRVGVVHRIMLTAADRTLGAGSGIALGDGAEPMGNV